MPVIAGLRIPQIHKFKNSTKFKIHEFHKLRQIAKLYAFVLHSRFQLVFIGRSASVRQTT